MKKILVLAALVAFGYSASSCRSKRADEPQKVQPTPTPGGDNTNPTTPTNPTNPTDPTTPSNPGGGGTVTPPSTDPNEVRPDAEAANAPVKLKMAEGLTFKVLEPTTGLKISGVTKQTDGSYKVNAGGLVGIDGVGEKLNIEAKGATELTLDTPIPGLKNLKAVTSEELKRISLSGLPNLETLNLTGANASSQVLDLSSFTKLKTLALGAVPEDWTTFDLEALRKHLNSGDGFRNEFAKIVFPPNVENVLLYRFHTEDNRPGAIVEGLDALPKLKMLYLHTCDLSKFGNLKLAQSANLQRLAIVHRFSTTVLPSLELSGKSKFADLHLGGSVTRKISLGGLTALKKRVTNYKISTSEMIFKGLGDLSAVETFIRLASKTPLTSLNLSGEAVLSADDVLSILRLLGTQGTITLSAAQATQAVRTAITAKGWTLNVAQ